MDRVWQILKRILIVTYLVCLHVLALYLLGDKLLKEYVFVEPLTTRAVRDPTAVEEIPTPLPVPSIVYEANVENNNTNSAPRVQTPGLIIPVAGVKPEQLTDAFLDSRSDGRIHDAIDIMAPQGTPVLAATNGKIVKFRESVPGGTTIYQLSDDGKFVFYYAHLQKRADGLSEGDPVKKGQTIGYVGDTGNAGTGNFHLHFSISRVNDPKRYWEGTYINPYPILKSGVPLQ